MATTQASTREELRKDVGHLLGAMIQSLTANSGSTTTMVVDELAIMTADDLNGKWLIFTSGQSNIDGEEVQITDSTVSSNVVTLTFHPVTSNAVGAGATAEMWDQEYRPAAIHNALNRAVNDVTGFLFEPTEDISLHTGGTSRFDLVATLDMVKDVQFRTGMESQIVVIGGQAWDESVSGSISSVTSDNEDRLFGEAATKIVWGIGVAGDLVSTDVPLIDLSGKTHIEFPIKVDKAVSASDLVLRLSELGNGLQTDKIINIPALSVGVDTWVRVAMTEAVSSFTPSEANDIISVALEYNAGYQTNIVWIGEVIATNEDSDIWESEERHLWGIDKQNQDLVFTYTPRSYLMKLVGGDNPLQLTSDTDVTEIPERYMVNQAAGTLLSRPVPGEDAETARIRERQSDRWLGMAERAKGAIQPLVNARFTF